MTICEVWECYNDGEPVFDANGEQTGIKPPLRLVEQRWKAEWRGGPTVGFIYFIFGGSSSFRRTAKPGGG
jgi:hypothetical protein